MKSTLLLATLLFSTGSFAFPFVYECQADFDVTLTVLSKSKITLTNEDEKDNLEIDLAYAAKNPAQKSLRLNGSASTLGDGSEGYTVYATISKSLVEGKKVGFLNRYGYGPDGAYSDSFKCTLK